MLAHGATIPVGQTTIPTDADELLAGLDGDTRAWFTSLLTELDAGTRGRGADIRALLRNLGPTAADTRQIGDLLAARRHELSSLVHNLGVLGQATAAKDNQLQTVVQAGRQTLGALAGQDVALQQSLQRLPPTLATTRQTLTDLATLSNQLGPTASALVPTARNLPTLLRQSNTLFSGAALLPLDQIQPFINAVTPLAGQLPGLEHSLSQITPQLIRSFKVLAYVTNEFAYSPGGRNPGFMYWFAWFAHNVDSFMASSDANGPAWRALLLTSCASLKSFAIGPLLQDRPRLQVRMLVMSDCARPW